MQKFGNILKALRLMIATLVFYALVCSLNSCDTCDSPSGGTGETKLEDRIFFTSFPINSVIPIIYSVANDGRSVSQHFSNATLFSSPSSNGKIAFLRYDKELGKNTIILASLDKSDSIEVDRDNKDYSIAQPILSPDGNKIAFNGGNKRLYLWVMRADGSSYIDKVSSNLFDNSLPSFSYDGKMLSYMESSKDSKSIVFKVVDSEKPDVTVYQHSLLASAANSSAELEIEWTSDNKNFSVFIEQGDTNRLIMFDFDKVQSFDFGNIGANSASLSPNGKFIVFTATNRSVWVRTTDEIAPIYSQLSESENNSNSLYYKWNYNGTKISFSKFYFDDGFGIASTLNLLKFSIINNIVFPDRFDIIGNNSYKGFWGRTKK